VSGRRPPRTGVDGGRLWYPSPVVSRRAEVTRAGLMIGLLALLALTNRWLSWTAGMNLVRDGDELIYRQIALAAPGLPTVPLPNQNAQSFGPSYVVGLVAHALGLSVESAFRVMVIVVILGVCLALHVALRQLALSTPAYAVCLAVLILNTYALRYYLLALGSIQDLGFVLVLAVAVGAMASRRIAIVLPALVLASFTRQTALPLGLVFAWWALRGPGWREARAAVRAVRAIALAVAPVLGYLIVLALVASFSAPTTPGVAGLTVLGDFEHLPRRLGALIEHLGRVLNPLFAVLILMLVVLISERGSVPVARRDPRRRGTLRWIQSIPFEARATAAIGGVIALQPLFLNTTYSGHPERLAVLSLWPLTLSLGYLLAWREREGRQVSPATAAAVAVVLAVGSLQYLYTVVGPADALQGAVLQLVTAALAGMLLWRGWRPAGRQRSPQAVSR
jgi:hypothetical protein